jgi:hypothetical protein
MDITNPSANSIPQQETHRARHQIKLLRADLSSPKGGKGLRFATPVEDSPDYPEGVCRRKARPPPPSAQRLLLKCSNLRKKQPETALTEKQ